MVRFWFSVGLHGNCIQEYFTFYVTLCMCVCVCGRTFTLLIRSWFFYRRIHMPGILRFGACKSCVACQASSLSRSVWIGRWFMHSRLIPKPLSQNRKSNPPAPQYCVPAKSVPFWPSISVRALRTNNLRN